MKIIVLVTNNLIQDQKMHRTCTSLKNLGHDVILVGRADKNSLEQLPLPFQTIRLPFKFQTGIIFYASVIWKYFWLLRAQKPDIVWSVDVDTIVPAITYKKIWGCKVIFDAHEYFHEVPELLHRPFKKWIWKMVARIYIPKADMHVTVSNTLSGIFENLYGKPFTVIWNVPYAQKKEVRVSSPKSKYIIYQGMLNKGRGLEVLIDAMPNIQELELWIVGEGDLSSELRQKTNASRAKDRIKFLGWMLPEDLRTITSGAYLGVNLLDGESLSYQYSMANKFFDYLQAGVPSVNMDFVEYRDFLDHYPVGLTLSKLEKNDIAEVINRVVEDKEFYNKLKSTAERVSSQFSWENEEKKIGDLLKSITKCA